MRNKILQFRIIYVQTIANFQILYFHFGYKFVNLNNGFLFAYFNRKFNGLARILINQPKHIRVICFVQFTLHCIKYMAGRVGLEPTTP